MAKGTITTFSCDVTTNGFQTLSAYVRDQAGNQLSEFTPGSGGSMVLAHTNVWANGVLIATDDVNKTHFYLNDWLGTRRVQTDDAGNLNQTCASLPYGDGETCGPAPTENLYTGKERDSESGNDYFGARYYASTVGRWLSPDWANDAQDVPYGNFADPQTLNLYQYVENDPLGKVDPDGHGDAGVMDAAGGLVVVFPEVAPIIIGGAIGIELGNAIWDNRGAILDRLANAQPTFPGPYVGPITDAHGNPASSVVFKNSSRANTKLQTSTALPKPPTGPGRVPKNQRDKRRRFSKKQTGQMLDRQGGKCLGCGEPKTLDEVDGHHILRHADGGTSDPEKNGAALCNGPGGCHEQIHKP